MATWDDFEKLDIRVGTITEASQFQEARKPAYILKIDFGPDIGHLKTSAQVTDLYLAADLVDSQVIAVVNFPPKQIGPMKSQCLVLGIYTKEGVCLLRPDKNVKNGEKIG
jgi:tRNA-binding protein